MPDQRRPELRRAKVSERLILVGKTQKLNASQTIDLAINEVDSSAERALLVVCRNMDSKLDASLQNQVILAESHDELREDITSLKDETEAQTREIGEIKTASEDVGRRLIDVEKYVQSTKTVETKQENRAYFKSGMRYGQTKIWGLVISACSLGIFGLWEIFKFAIETYLSHKP